MEVKAKISFARMAPRKIRLVADMVRGKDVNEALQILTFVNKKSGLYFEEVIAVCGRKR